MGEEELIIDKFLDPLCFVFSYPWRIGTAKRVGSKFCKSDSPHPVFTHPLHSHPVYVFPYQWRIGTATRFGSKFYNTDSPGPAAYDNRTSSVAKQPFSSKRASDAYILRAEIDQLQLPPAAAVLHGSELRRQRQETTIHLQSNSIFLEYNQFLVCQVVL